MDPNFNSDDLEFSDHEEDTSRFGLRSMAAIVEDAMALRVASKKFTAQLTDQSGTAQTRAHKKRWWNIFKTFMKDALNKE